MSKVKVGLNPDYYSDYEYEEEPQDQNNIRIFFQVLMVFIIFLMVVFTYKYVMKHYYKNIVAWITEEKKAPLTIAEKNISSEVYKLKVVETKKQVVKKETVAIDINFKREKDKNTSMLTKVTNDELLSNEYIKLVQQSLGNY